MRGRPRLHVVPIVIVGVLAGLLGTAPAASAVTTSGWAAWTPVTGRANDYATTMSLPAGGFPRAVVASNSRAAVALPTGATTYLGPTTPVGAKYGTSRNQAYLNPRPEADSATTPSTTTYSFDGPTPTAGWTFVLGDIDADKVSIAAGGADGRLVPAATVDGWYRSSFNYAGGTDRPVWDGATSTLTGNAAASDTDGAAAWFEPDVALTSLTFRFTARAGFPIYQTWFAGAARTISGRVDDVSAGGGAGCAVDASVVRLLAPDGSTLASTSPSGGAYSFGQYAERDGYRVTVETPAGCAVTGPRERTVDTRTQDATADFTVRVVIPQAVTGTVTTTAGDGLAGVDVTLTPPAPGTPKTTTTDADGRYLFDDNAEQAGYAVAVTGVPEGYDVTGPASRTFDIDPGATVPAQDFSVREQVGVAGTVSGGGEGLGGVAVSITPAGGGTAVGTATTGDGTYAFPHVPSGQYDISVDAPPGYRPVAALTDVVVGTQDRTGLDFALSRPGTVSGQVGEPDGTPLPGVRVDVVGDKTGTTTVTTDADGLFLLGDLDPDRYRLTAVPPAGYRVDGTTERTVTVTAAGEVLGGLDFTVVRAVPSGTPTPSPSSSEPSPPVPSGGATGTGGASGGSLAATGTDLALLTATGLAALAAGVLLVTRARRRC